ncbi:hypothetical protein ACFXG4_08455 [Nocardia sp. NPDC059246]|uniref:hypothetical protein n=1 Tax=unclassified Nocardia TaxID=2637762 RepID=UPI0036A7931F
MNAGYDGYHPAREMTARTRLLREHMARVFPPWLLPDESLRLTPRLLDWMPSPMLPPDEPLWPTVATAQPKRPAPQLPDWIAPPMRAAVLPMLTPAEQWTLAHVLGTLAAGVRVRLWDGEFNLRGNMHPAKDRPGWQVCPGDGCAWCAWAANPNPELLPAMYVWPNPFLPNEVSHDPGSWGGSSFTLDSLPVQRPGLWTVQGAGL